MGQETGSFIIREAKEHLRGNFFIFLIFVFAVCSAFFFILGFIFGYNMAINDLIRAAESVLNSNLKDLFLRQYEIPI